MITYSKATSEKEFKEILELQKRNLPTNLSADEKKQEGFLTVQHSLEILQKMNARCPHTIATYNDKVIGYALSMTQHFCDDIEILKPLFFEISKTFLNEKYIVMGQVCVDKEYRKKGVFRGLYTYMKAAVAKDYELIITEIDAKNKRSLQAHEAVGFVNVKTYFYNHQQWQIVSLKAP